MIEVIYNDDSKVHLRIEGRTYEECNVDQVLRAHPDHHTKVMSLRQYLGLETELPQVNTDLCERCFQ